MTALRERLEIKAPAGMWVRVHSQYRNVWVSDAEIDAALARDDFRRKRKHARSRLRVAENIALGKAIGAYREWPRTKEEA